MMLYDSVTAQIRQSYECSAVSIKDCTNMVRFSYDILECIGEIRHESVKNTPEASTNHLRIMDEKREIRGSS